MPNIPSRRAKRFIVSPIVGLGLPNAMTSASAVSAAGRPIAHARLDIHDRPRPASDSLSRSLPPRGPASRPGRGVVQAGRGESREAPGASRSESRKRSKLSQVPVLILLAKPIHRVLPGSRTLTVSERPTNPLIRDSCPRSSPRSGPPRPRSSRCRRRPCARCRPHPVPRRPFSAIAFSPPQENRECRTTCATAR